MGLRAVVRVAEGGVHRNLAGLARLEGVPRVAAVNHRHGHRHRVRNRVHCHIGRRLGAVGQGRVHRALGVGRHRQGAQIHVRVRRRLNLEAAAEGGLAQARQVDGHRAVNRHVVRHRPKTREVVGPGGIEAGDHDGGQIAVGHLRRDGHVVGRVAEARVLLDADVLGAVGGADLGRHHGHVGDRGIRRGRGRLEVVALILLHVPGGGRAGNGHQTRIVDLENLLDIPGTHLAALGREAVPRHQHAIGEHQCEYGRSMGQHELRPIPVTKVGELGRVVGPEELEKARSGICLPFEHSYSPPLCT